MLFDQWININGDIEISKVGNWLWDFGFNSWFIQSFFFLKAIISDKIWTPIASSKQYRDSNPCYHQHEFSKVQALLAPKAAKIQCICGNCYVLHALAIYITYMLLFLRFLTSSDLVEAGHVASFKMNLSQKIFDCRATKLRSKCEMKKRMNAIRIRNKCIALKQLFC